MTYYAKKGGQTLVDIHCHILPEFDDGASSPDEAIAMAHMAAASGVTAIVATPHFPGKSSSLQRIPDLLDRYDWLRRALRTQGLPLKIYPGAEILCLPETPDLAARRALPTIGESSYLLTEFYFNESFAYMDEMLAELSACGYTPVVAHPERYHVIGTTPALLERWMDKGYVLQLNKGSLLGAFGPQVRDTALEALDAGFAHLVASDAHGANRRTPHMGQLRHWLKETYGEKVTEILLDRNPARLIADKGLIPLK